MRWAWCCCLVEAGFVAASVTVDVGDEGNAVALHPRVPPTVVVIFGVDIGVETISRSVYICVSRAGFICETGSSVHKQVLTACRNPTSPGKDFIFFFPSHGGRSGCLQTGGRDLFYIDVGIQLVQKAVP